ncbi:MAG: hypothetical protein AB1817_02405 [Chloroflexota bacterium]
MPEWDPLREKHRAFWTRGAAETPISGDKRTTAFVLGDYQFTVTDRALKPEDIELPRVLAWADALYQRGDGFLDGELVWGLPPLPGVPWMEAILGCPIWVAEASHSLWAAPWLDDWDALEKILPLASNPWYCKLLELTDALVRRANGCYPVTQTLMRGPADLAVALRGHERFCLDMLDQPERASQLARRCTEIWIQVARALLARIPPFDGGYTAPRLEVWAPGQLVRFEEDATILFSSRLYREFFQECDRRIAASFDYALIHTHSANHRLIAALLEIPELPAIQVILDPTGPSFVEMIPILQKIQSAGKALLITHELADETLNSLLNNLSPRGLAVERMIST